MRSWHSGPCIRAQPSPVLPEKGELSRQHSQLVSHSVLMACTASSAGAGLGPSVWKQLQQSSKGMKEAGAETTCSVLIEPQSFRLERSSTVT